MNCTDFIVGFELSGRTDSFSEKNDVCKKLEKQFEKCNTESLKAEKKCECKCKSNQDFYKELLGQFEECRKILGEGPSAETIMHFMSTFFDIEKKLRTEIEKSDTDESPIYWIKCEDDDENFITNLLKHHKFRYDFEANEKADTTKSCQCAEKCLTDDDINEALENGKRSDKIIYLPKTEKEKITKLINECFRIIKRNSDVDFLFIKGYLLDILRILQQCEWQQNLKYE